MSITDELREWVNGAKPAVVDGCSISVGTMTYGCKKALLAIADRIDAEHERVEQDLIDANNQMERLCECSIELPVDANGERVHAGDKLDGYGKTIEVVELRYGRSGWVLISRDGNAYADTFAFTHHHEPTVEDVLREFACVGIRIGSKDGIEAGKFTFYPDEDMVAEYAAKLRLAEGEDA